MLDLQELAAYTPRELIGFSESMAILEKGFEKGLDVIKLVGRKNATVSKSVHAIERLFAELIALNAQMNQYPQDLENKIEQAKNIIIHIQQNLQVIHDQLEVVSAKDLAQNLIKVTKGLNLSNNFLVRPIGIKEIVWLINYRLNELKPHQREEAFQAELKELLQAIVKELREYQENNIEPINRVVDLATAFLQKHPEAVETFPWIEGIKQECQVMQKRYQAVQIREELDKMYIEVLGKKNDAELIHAKALKALQEKYKIKPEPKFSKNPLVRGLKGVASFFNFAKDMRKAKYLKEKVNLNKRLQETLHKITNDQHKKYYAKVIQLEEDFRRLEKEVLELDSRYVNAIVMPLSFQNHRAIKTLATEYGGTMVGGLAQSKVIALGSSNGLCYGFTKAWVLLMNSLRHKSEDYEIIDALNAYGKESEKVKKGAIDEVNTLVLNSKYFKYFDEQQADRRRNIPELKRKIPLSPSFAARALSVLHELKSPSLIIAIGGDEGGHILGLVKTRHGYWFHDSNNGCIYFPSIGAKTEKNVTDFLQKYLATFYSNYAKGSFIALPDKIDKQFLMEDHRLQNWTPTYLLSKQVTEKQQEKVKPLSLHRKKAQGNH